MNKSSNQVMANPGAAPPAFKSIDHCRLCGCKRWVPVLDLEQQCISDGFYRPGDSPCTSAPLELVRCNECSLVQLAHSFDAHLVRRSRWNKPAVDRSMRENLASLVDQVMRLAPLCSDDTVIDIGCHDGALLSHYPQDLRKIGVDPSMVAWASGDGLVDDGYRQKMLAKDLAGRKAKIITSIDVLSRLDDPQAFVESIEVTLDEGGIWVLEFPYLPSMLRAVSYDTIFHEQVAYYRLRTIERLLEETDLELFDVGFNGCIAGSFRLFVAPRGSRQIRASLAKAKVDEANGLFDTRYPYEGFQTGVFRAREALLNFLHEAKVDGKSVYGYGASPQGQVTLQSCGPKTKQIVAIADRDPEKRGLLTPGTAIPICSEEEMRAARPDYLLVLTWRSIHECLARESAYLRAGGRLVVALPEFRVYSAADLG